MMTKPLFSTAGMNTPITVPSTVPDAAEQAGAADDHARDGVEVVRGVPGDGGGAEVGERHEAGQPGEQSGQHVDQDQVPGDADAGARGRPRRWSRSA